MKKTVLLKLTAALFSIILLITSFAGCSSGSPVAMKIGDYEISYDMLRYFVMNYKRDYEAVAPGKIYEDEALQAELVENTNATLKEFAAYYILVKRYKLKLTDDQESAIDQQISSLKKGYSSTEDYESDLAKNYVTEEVLREIYRMQAYCDTLYSYLTNEYYGIFQHDDATIMADVNAGNYFADEYIMIHFDDSTRDERKTVAEEIAKRAKEGESLSKLSAEYEKVITGEYYDEETFEYVSNLLYHKDDVFGKGEMLSYFEEAVSALKENEVSDLIERSDGFLVVKRLPLDVDNNFNAIIASYLSRQFFGFVEETSADLAVVMTRKYRDIKYWEIE